MQIKQITRAGLTGLVCLMTGAAAPIVGGPPGGAPTEFLQPPLPADAPKPSPDPHNIEGTYFHIDGIQMNMDKTMRGQPVPSNDKAKALMARRAAQQATGLPYAYAAVKCLPPGQPWQIDINFPFTVLQTPQEIVFLFQEFHGAWVIRMNAPHLVTGPRQYMGDSVGHWDGDTLVVDTIRYKKMFLVDNDVTGVPVSPDGHLVFRIRKIDEEQGPSLEIITTFDDPAYYTAKWSTLRSFAWRPDRAMLEEYNCEEQVTAPDALSSLGYVPDPDLDGGTAKPSTH